MNKYTYTIIKDLRSLYPTMDKLPSELWVCVFKDLDLNSTLNFMSTCSEALYFIDEKWKRLFRLNKQLIIHEVYDNVNWHKVIEFSFAMHPIEYTKKLINWFDICLTLNFLDMAILSDDRSKLQYLIGHPNFPEKFSSNRVLKRIINHDSVVLFQEYLIENIENADEWINAAYKKSHSLLFYIFRKNAFKIFQFITLNQIKINNFVYWTTITIETESTNYLNCLMSYEWSDETFDDVLHFAFSNSESCVVVLICSDQFNTYDKYHALHHALESGYVDIVDMITTHEIKNPNEPINPYALNDIHENDNTTTIENNDDHISLLDSIDIGWCEEEEIDWKQMIKYIARIPWIRNEITENTPIAIYLVLDYLLCRNSA